MLTLLGKRQRFCDGVSRRNFLKIGALGVGSLGFGSLALPDLLRAEASSAAGAVNNRSIINIYLGGGPSHIDTFDLKPDAPPEIRGEFHPIPTTVPGMQICQHMPKLASIATKFSIVRSLTGIRDEHAVDQSESGWSENDLRSMGGHPCIGSVVAKLQGATRGAVPTFVDLTGHTKHGFLGPVYSGFRPDGEGRNNLRLRGEITSDRFHSRAELLSKLDHLRRDMDSSRAMDAMDAFNQRAYGVIASPKLAEALEWEKADVKVRERYGAVEHQENSRFMVAKRLIETGVRIVSFSWGGWDTHGDNFNALRRMLPPLDVGLSALIDDLESSGMLDSTMVVMWGEFGRTPRVNPGAGRDHWAGAASAFVTGGGLKRGQVIGSTNRYAETAHDRPVHIQEMFATFYQQLGIDPKTATIRDPNGRPQYLTAHPDPVPELVG